MKTIDRIPVSTIRRASKHFIDINRTFFGLCNLMFDLKAQGVRIHNFNTL